MPYYPDVAGAPQNSIIGGASLWVMGGKSAPEYKGVAKFFTFLSDTDRQVELHKKSGYLPITKAAYEKTKASGYYKEFPYLETPLLELTNKEPTENSRGPAARQHGAAARRVGRGVRGGAGGQEDRPSRRSTMRSPAATPCCASSSARCRGRRAFPLPVSSAGRGSG